jgi:hypothetical protein
VGDAAKDLPGHLEVSGGWEGKRGKGRSVVERTIATIRPCR